jgi:hypothetical protein
MAAPFYPIPKPPDRAAGHNGPVRWVRGLVLLTMGAAAAFGVERLVLRPAVSTGAPAPVPRSEPGPGDPPVAWLQGTLESISETDLALREGQGPRIPIERFAAGATSFLRRDGGGWLELTEPEIEVLEAGTRACVETLLDGGTFLALRVFLAADCGPSGGG